MIFDTVLSKMCQENIPCKTRYGFIKSMANGRLKNQLGAKLRIALVHMLYVKCPVPLGLLQIIYVNLFLSEP